MKTGFTVVCIIFAVFIMFFATFNICITHTEKKVELVNKRIVALEYKCDSLETALINYQIKDSATDTVVLNILYQHPVNLKYNNTKKK